MNRIGGLPGAPILLAATILPLMASIGGCVRLSEGRSGVAAPGTERQDSSSNAQVESQISVHPWWNVTVEHAKEQFDAGRQLYQKGGDRGDISQYGVTWDFDPNRVEPEYLWSPLGRKGRILDGDMILWSAQLSTPQIQANAAGWGCEKLMVPDEKTDLIPMILVEMQDDIRFVICMTNSDDLDALYDVNFALETDTGQRILPLGDVRPDTSVDHNGSSRFRANYEVKFPLYDERKRPYLTVKSKSVRLWIITMNKRTPITWQLQDTLHVKVGDSVGP